MISRRTPVKSRMAAERSGGSPRRLAEPDDPTALGIFKAISSPIGVISEWVGSVPTGGRDRLIPNHPTATVLLKLSSHLAKKGPKGASPYRPGTHGTWPSAITLPTLEEPA
jgi:hypothetical protein